MEELKTKTIELLTWDFVEINVREKKKAKCVV